MVVLFVNCSYIATLAVGYVPLIAPIGILVNPAALPTNRLAESVPVEGLTLTDVTAPVILLPDTTLANSK